MLFNKLTLISIAAIIAIASILVFIIPTDSIETQSVINSEKSSINHTLSIDQSISVSEANNRVAINLFKLLENDTQKNIFFSPFRFNSDQWDYQVEIPQCIRPHSF